MKFSSFCSLTVLIFQPREKRMTGQWKYETASISFYRSQRVRGGLSGKNLK